MCCRYWAGRYDDCAGIGAAWTRRALFGSRRYRGKPQRCIACRNRGSAPPCPMDLAVCRAWGGTSWTWGGRCEPYDPVDWMERDFVAEARWPIESEAVARWNQRASQILQCGERFDIPYQRQLTAGLTVDFVERWASRSQLMLAYRDPMLKSERIRLSLNSTVTGMNLSSDGQRVQSLAVTTPKGRCLIRPR